MRRINHSSRFIEEFQGKGYKSQKLNSFAQVVTGSTPSRSVSDYWLNGAHPWVSAQDMGDKFVDATAELVSDSGMATCKLIPAGSLLYVCRGSIGVMSINRIDCATNQSICSAICDDSICKTEYLYYWLLYHEDEINSLGEGTSFKSLSQKTFASLKIQIPPIEEQLRFIAITRQADKSKFSDFKSRFIEMFGNPVDSQEMGTLCVGDLCSVISGFPFKSELFNDNKVGKPLIRIRDVVRGYTETYTTEESDSQFIVKTGDLLVGMDGNFEISVWKSEEALLNQRVCMITPKDERITRNYIIYAVQPALTAIEEKTNATTVKHISASQISSIRLPRVEEVRVAEFDNVVRQADKSKYLN